MNAAAQLLRLAFLFFLVSRPCYTFDGDDDSLEVTEAEPREKYIIDLDIATDYVSLDSINDLEARFANMFCFVHKRTEAARLENGTWIHIRDVGSPFNEIQKNTTDWKECACKVIGSVNTNTHTIVSTVFYYNNQTVNAQVSAAELSQLTLSHISAFTSLPIVGLSARITTSLTIRIWIVGGALLVALCGWLCMFIYYNTCGATVSKPHQSTAEIYTVHRPEDDNIPMKPPLIQLNDADAENTSDTIRTDLEAEDEVNPLTDGDDRSASLVSLHGSLNDDDSKTKISVGEVERHDPEETKQNMSKSRSPPERRRPKKVKSVDEVPREPIPPLPDRDSYYYAGDYVHRLKMLTPINGEYSRNPHITAYPQAISFAENI